MKKRILLLLLCATLFLAMIPTALTASAIEVEGDWTTHRFADAYDTDDAYLYQPASGYRYTDEGFATVPPDYTNITPGVSVVSKERLSVKEGIYLQFRVDAFSYDGCTGADEWIALTLSTEEKVCPGSTAYGGGWLGLIRGQGDGNGTSQAFLTDPQTDDFAGSFTFVGQQELSIPLDNQGREIYTLEITWDGATYEMKLNGVTLSGGEESTALLETLDPNGEFFLGISMQSSIKDGDAALTILKYGTCEADATTPVGSDAREPEYEGCIWPDLPDVIYPNEPAILWSPATTPDVDWPIISSAGPDAWRMTATDEAFFMLFNTERSQTYLAEDVPVFGIMFRNLWADGGILWYAAGDVTTPQEEWRIPFSVYDGEFYEDRATGIDYIFVPVNLTDLWAGRIHTIRLDMNFPDLDHREFDVCFAGMFRNMDEAYAYAENYLISMDVIHVMPVVTEPSANTEPAGEDGPTHGRPETVVPPAADTAPENEIVYEEDTEDPVLRDVMEKYGCTAALAGSVLLPLLLGALLLRKKES